jgi:hypothetical protein
VVQAAARQLNLGLNMNRVGIDAMDPSKSMEKRVTAPARDFISFGMGNHACPGKEAQNRENSSRQLMYLCRTFLCHARN